MKKAFAIILLLVLGVGAYSQSTQGGSQFDAAVEAFESGEYERTISLLAAYEKSNGTSPRLESLRALAYRDLEKPKEAHQAVLVYLRLTAKRDMSGSEAHQDMVELRDEMLEAIEKKYKEDKEKLDKERDETATSVVQELEEIYSSPQIKRSYSSALPASLKTEADDANGEYIGPVEKPKTAAQGMDSLAELEMWRKINQSTVAMDYFLFIESFPNGQFTEIARKKMHEIGDPAWNAVRDSFDPFKFRDFIKANPDSPFLAIAKNTMDALATLALRWEQVKVTQNEQDLRNFENWYPKTPYAAEAKRLRGENAWIRIKNSNDPKVFAQFLNEFPNSVHAGEASAAIKRLGGSSVPAETPGSLSSESDAKAAVSTGPAISKDHGGFARFNNIKADFIRKQSAWSTFKELEPCRVEFSIHIYYEDPQRSTSELNFRDIAEVEVRKIQRVWTVVVTNTGDKSFSLEHAVFTRNPLWGSVKETKKGQSKSVSVARFSDQMTAESLANLIREKKTQCASQ